MISKFKPQLRIVQTPNLRDGPTIGTSIIGRWLGKTDVEAPNYRMNEQLYYQAHILRR
jgi:hypothetical protein